MITYKYLGKLQNQNEMDALWELLKACDKEFVPYLSERTYEEEEMVQSVDKKDGPVNYYRMLLSNYIIAAYEEDEIVAILAFSQEHKCDSYPVCLNSNYIINICVHPKARGQHIAVKLYEFMEKNLPELQRRNLLTIRTWSTNQTQIYLLDKLGYQQGAVIKNDRGNGIDTIYFYKEVDK